jgi:hypothetical protein
MHGFHRVLEVTFHVVPLVPLVPLLDVVVVHLEHRLDVAAVLLALRRDVVAVPLVPLVPLLDVVVVHLVPRLDVVAMLLEPVVDVLVDALNTKIDSNKRGKRYVFSQKMCICSYVPRLKIRVLKFCLK